MKKISLIILSVFILLLAGCMGNSKKDNQNSADTSSNQKTVVSSGDAVKVDYIGTFESGDVFDTSIEQVAKDHGLYTTGRNYQPLPFTVGAHQMISGFEKAVIGMKVGETKKVKLAPADAYGDANPEYITGVSMDTFKQARIEPKVGQSYNFGTMAGRVLEINGDKVKIDFNSPMAGKTLNFEITVKEIK